MTKIKNRLTNQKMEQQDCTSEQPDEGAAEDLAADLDNIVFQLSPSDDFRNFDEENVNPNSETVKTEPSETCSTPGLEETEHAGIKILQAISCRTSELEKRKSKKHRHRHNKKHRHKKEKKKNKIQSAPVNNKSTEGEIQTDKDGFKIPPLPPPKKKKKKPKNVNKDHSLSPPSLYKQLMKKRLMERKREVKKQRERMRASSNAAPKLSINEINTKLEPGALKPVWIWDHLDPDDELLVAYQRRPGPECKCIFRDSNY